jgi:hypothetical protein
VPCNITLGLGFLVSDDMRGVVEWLCDQCQHWRLHICQWVESRILVEVATTGTHGDNCALWLRGSIRTEKTRRMEKRGTVPDPVDLIDKRCSAREQYRWWRYAVGALVL